MNFPGKCIQLETIIWTVVTLTQKEKHVYTYLQVNNNHKVQDIHNTLHRLKEVTQEGRPVGQWWHMPLIPALGR